MVYSISDVAKKVDVEAHVLRYWEEELSFQVSRNGMGHRCYTEEDVEKIRGIKYLKEQGFQLKAIRILLPEIKRVLEMEENSLLKIKEHMDRILSKEEQEQKIPKQGEEKKEDPGKEKKNQTSEQWECFQKMMKGILVEVMQDNNQKLSEQVRVMMAKELEYQMREKERLEEERFKKLDRTIREYQQGKKQVAATKESIRGRKDSKYFKKHPYSVI